MVGSYIQMHSKQRKLIIGVHIMERFTTETLAQRLGLKPHTLRAAYCRTGSYFGIKPTKFPNGRLLWPADSIERLMDGKAAA